ncbi:MAG: hypothetical protein HQ538_05010, partial [Parcubacteria group bacterium]|nr:hypothetical protein [Parcubacteria group bacterium]
MLNKDTNITYFSTWPETNDGIATFCENLAIHLPSKYKNYRINWNVVMVEWMKQRQKKHSDKIIGCVKYNKLSDYKKAAFLINKSNTELVVIQFINSIY